jgi:thiosulfate/3-mercaptopyruvate sulfurtransferase
MTLPSKGLVPPDALAKDLAASETFVLDVRSVSNGGGRTAFEAAHVPGAQHTDYAADGWRVKVGGAPGVMPDLAAIAAIAGQLGLEKRHRVVLVVAGISATDLAAAARVAWTLRMAGHQHVAVLDGGMASWIAEGLPIETGPPKSREATTYPLTAPTALRAQAPDVLAALSRTSPALIDARSESYFRGREKASESLAAGHIPGALNIDYVKAYDPAANRLRPLPDLKALYGDVPAGPVISYCNTGHTAALNWFALAEVLGREDVALYDGSMTDWTQDPSRPVAT